MHIIIRLGAFIALIFLFSPLAKAQTTSSDDVVLQTMKSELARENAELSKQSVEPYYISYNVGDEQKVSMTASYGTISRSDSSRHRMLQIGRASCRERV